MFYLLCLIIFIDSQSKQKPTTKPSANTPQTISLKPKVMPLPAVVLSSFGNLGLLIWCILWGVMTVLIDPKRLTLSITQNVLPFTVTTVSFVGAVLYVFITTNGRGYILDRGDRFIIAVARMIGVICALLVFKVYFFDTLLVTDIRDALPVESLAKDITDAI